MDIYRASIWTLCTLVLPLALLSGCIPNVDEGDAGHSQAPSDSSQFQEQVSVLEAALVDLETRHGERLDAQQAAVEGLEGRLAALEANSSEFSESVAALEQGAADASAQISVLTETTNALSVQQQEEVLRGLTRVTRTYHLPRKVSLPDMVALLNDIWDCEKDY